MFINPYDEQGMDKGHYPLVNVDMQTWHQDLVMFMDEGPIIGFREPFFRKVAVPVLQSYAAFKDLGNPDRFAIALEIIQQCQDIPWGNACYEWLKRREEKHLRAQDDGVHYDK